MRGHIEGRVLDGRPLGRDGNAEDVGDLVERAVRKAEGALNDAAKRVGVKVPMPRSSRAPDSTQSWRVNQPSTPARPTADQPSKSNWPQAHDASPELVNDSPERTAAPTRKTVRRKVAAKSKKPPVKKKR